MKRITAILLILSLMLLCWGCHKELENKPEEPQIRYENGTAFYTQKGGDYTMELRFMEPVLQGSEIKVLLEEQEVLGFTTQAPVSCLQISSPELALNRPYTITVNGKLQRHSVKPDGQEFPRPGDIPAPTQPTQPPIPVEPMGEIITIPTQERVEQETISLGDFSPPDFSSDTELGEIPSLLPPSNTEEEETVESGGLLPIEPFKPHDQEDEVPGTGILQIPTQRRSNIFTLTEKVTVFVSVGDAT